MRSSNLSGLHMLKYWSNKPKDPNVERFGTYEEIANKIAMKNIDEKFEKTKVGLEEMLEISAGTTTKASKAPVDAPYSSLGPRRI